MQKSEQIVRSIKVRLWVLTGVVVLLCLVVGGFSAYSFVATRQIKSAACTLRGDYEQRIVEGHKLLREHPEGIANISAKVLKVSIENQEKTVESLRELPC